MRYQGISLGGMKRGMGKEGLGRMGKFDQEIKTQTENTTTILIIKAMSNGEMLFTMEHSEKRLPLK